MSWLIACPMLLAFGFSLPERVPGPPRGRSVVKRGSRAWKRANPAPRTAGPRIGIGRAPQPVINLLNLHTGEFLAVVGQRLPKARLVNRFFRCRWTGRRAPLDPRLLDWILQTARHFGADEVQFISGFRHHKFNEMLRKKGRQVARRSKHTLGQALDFRLVGVPVEQVVRYLKQRRWGGIGWYPQSKFIHLDVGRYRVWSGI